MEKLYLTVEEAAKWSGIGIGRIREMVNSIDPPPLFRAGNKVLIQREKFPLYLESKQEVVWNG